MSAAASDSHERCPHCGKELNKPLSPPQSVTGELGPRSQLQQGPDTAEKVLKTLGSYQIVDTIGKGGMGEVLLAFDTICNRYVALKKVRADLKERDLLLSRFLEEATITSQLAHPAIIPIYSIHLEEDELYYIMPYVQGRTLKQVLRTTRQQEKAGETLDPLGGCISALARVFLTICQAVAFAHSHGVLHRDLKPENIIIGKYGEVMILDWGLAQLMEEAEQVLPPSASSQDSNSFSRSGKIVGTIHYMAPERAFGKPSTVQSDIYALGVMLYQILTLHHPFRRKSLDHFRKVITQETFPPPETVAPYREVPRVLSQIVTRCLEKNPNNRYESVEELIGELEGYLEGRSEWFRIGTLRPSEADDWEFRENVLIAEHTAVTGKPVSSSWVQLMLSKRSFARSIKVSTRVRLSDASAGVGLLICVPEASERTHINDGYCLWIAAEGRGSSALSRSGVEVHSSSELQLEPNRWYDITFAKRENHLWVEVDGNVSLSFVSHIPLLGTHIGYMTRDEGVEVEQLDVCTGGHSVLVSCLAIPDAFLAYRDYDHALSEYRRIGYAFPGREEGREALFRAGVTLLEQARHCPLTHVADRLFDQALEEFEKLHDTPGAPLEYLGKAHVYQVLREFEEELKCYELAFRRYPLHPILHLLEEHIGFRIHNLIKQSRRAGYGLALLITTHLHELRRQTHVMSLFEQIQENWEVPPWMEPQAPRVFSTTLAFWRGYGWQLHEISQSTQDPMALHNLLYSLIELGEMDSARKVLGEAESPHLYAGPRLLLEVSDPDARIEQAQALWGEQCHQAWPLILSLRQQLDQGQTTHVLNTALPPSEQWALRLDALQIWALLLEERWDEAGERLHAYPQELLHHESTVLFFLYGCWLAATEGVQIAAIHFCSIMDSRYPPTVAIGAHHIAGKIDDHSPWLHESFRWERMVLWRQLSLYYHCLGDQALAAEYRQRLLDQSI